MAYRCEMLRRVVPRLIFVAVLGAAACGPQPEPSFPTPIVAGKPPSTPKPEMPVLPTPTAQIALPKPKTTPTVSVANKQTPTPASDINFGSNNFGGPADLSGGAGLSFEQNYFQPDSEELDKAEGELIEKGARLRIEWNNCAARRRITNREYTDGTLIEIDSGEDPQFCSRPKPDPLPTPQRYPVRGGRLDCGKGTLPELDTQDLYWEYLYSDGTTERHRLGRQPGACGVSVR
jgi:hypothetical protein